MVLTCITVYKYRSQGLVRCNSNVGSTGSLSLSHMFRSQCCITKTQFILVNSGNSSFWK